jgi:hypothetical protein
MDLHRERHTHGTLYDGSISFAETTAADSACAGRSSNAATASRFACKRTRVVLQHLTVEMTRNGHQSLIGYTGFCQLRNAIVPWIVEPKSRQVRLIGKIPTGGSPGQPSPGLREDPPVTKGMIFHSDQFCKANANKERPAMPTTYWRPFAE